MRYFCGFYYSSIFDIVAVECGYKFLEYCFVEDCELYIFVSSDLRMILSILMNAYKRNYKAFESEVVRKRKRNH